MSVLEITGYVFELVAVLALGLALKWLFEVGYGDDRPAELARTGIAAAMLLATAWVVLELLHSVATQLRLDRDDTLAAGLTPPSVGHFIVPSGWTVFVVGAGLSVAALVAGRLVRIRKRASRPVNADVS